MGVDQLITGGDVDDPVVDSLNTDELLHGPTGTVLAKREDVAEQSSNVEESDATLSFSGLSPDATYYIKIDLLSRESGVLNLTVNGDDAGGNGNYGYWDETGTKQAGVDAIEVLDYDAFTQIGGGIRVFGDGDNRVGIDNELLPTRTENITGFCQKGGWNNAEILSSVTITSTGGLTSDDKAELWRVL